MSEFGKGIIAIGSSPIQSTGGATVLQGSIPCRHNPFLKVSSSVFTTWFYPRRNGSGGALKGASD